MSQPNYTKCRNCQKIMIEEMGKSPIFIAPECLELSRIVISSEVENCPHCNTSTPNKSNSIQFPIVNKTIPA